MGLPVPTFDALNSKITSTLKPVAQSLLNPGVLSKDVNQIDNIMNLIKIIAGTAKPLIKEIGGPYAKVAIAVSEVVEGDIKKVFGLSALASIPMTLPTKDSLAALIKKDIDPVAKEVLQPLVTSIDPKQLDNIYKLTTVVAAMGPGIVEAVVEKFKELILAAVALAKLQYLPIPEFPTVDALKNMIVTSVTPVAKAIFGPTVLSIDPKQIINLTFLIELIAGVAIGFTEILTKALKALADLVKKLQNMVKAQEKILKKLMP